MKRCNIQHYCVFLNITGYPEKGYMSHSIDQCRKFYELNYVNKSQGGIMGKRDAAIKKL